MKKSEYPGGRVLQGMLPALLVLALALSLVLFGLKSARQATMDEGEKIAQESIMRAVVTCYSIENRYPESFEYLKERYGISIDEDKYVVHYEVFASNLMPVVTVVRRFEE